VELFRADEMVQVLIKTNQKTSKKRQTKDFEDDPLEVAIGSRIEKVSVIQRSAIQCNAVQTNHAQQPFCC
jgi:hypothetical protein